MSFPSLSVRAKLSAAFALLALLVLLAAALSFKALGDANARFVDYVRGINARATLSDEVRTAVDRRAIAVRNLVLVETPAEREAELDAAMKAHQDVESRITRLVAMASGAGVPEQVLAKVRRIEAVEHDYAPIAQDIVALVKAGKHDEAIARMNNDCRPHLAALVRATNDYREFTATREEAQLEAANRDYQHQRIALSIACVLATGFAVVATATIPRSLMRALGAEPADLGAAARRVAEGDLAPVPGASAASEGSVLASLGAMQARLSSIVAQVRSASASIATGSTQIAAGNADLSQRTEEQASALQQTSATMDQLGVTVSHNADNARQANQLANGARDVAARGGDVVSRVVSTMREINDSSKRISDIIGVIDGIAFQTNILALNAAVEAARAGEQGRGFAVVATEVRSLAQRSAEAAREIKGLITRSVEQVEGGTTLVDEAGRTMTEIVTAIHRVSDIVGEISSASAEQSAGVSQVGQAVAQMDHVTQQNAALVEQSAAAAESLRQQTERLVEVVSVFRVQA